MQSEDFSCIKEVTKVVNLTLPFMYNTNEISGICDVLESWKRQYVKQLQGIVVGYKNVSLTSKRGYIKADFPVIYCNVKATFELFYPTIGSFIKGKINRISQDHIGCLVHDTINVTVHRTDDTPSDISKFIALDNFILFQVTGINFKSKFIHVKGKITLECITIMKESGLFSDNIHVCDNDAITGSPLDFCNNNNSSIFNSNPILKTGELDISTDTSSQTSSRKKKKKHKRSKENSPMSERKRKKSDVNLTSPCLESKDESEPKHSKKKIKTEKLITNDVSQVKLTQSSDNVRKRKRKKSDINLMSSADSSENETMPIHPKKKLKTEEQIIWTNNTVDADYSLKSEINENDYSLPNTSLQIITPSSHNSLTSPDLFDESIGEEKSVKAKKKKKNVSDKDKLRKKKKDKLKKGSKASKKKKLKVISTKKKLHGHNSKLKKKKNKDKKSKNSKKSKNKDKKTKSVPE